MSEGIADGILVFRDPEGQQWLCGIRMGPLCRFVDGKIVEELTHSETKDKGFLLHDIRVVEDA